MNSLMKSFLGLALLFTMAPALIAVGEDDGKDNNKDTKGWWESTKETVKNEKNLFTSWTSIKTEFNRSLTGKLHVVGLPLAALSIPAILAYKYCKPFQDAVDKGASKAKEGYKTFVDYVKVNKGAQYALAGAGAAATAYGIYKFWPSKAKGDDDDGGDDDKDDKDKDKDKDEE